MWKGSECGLTTSPLQQSILGGDSEDTETGTEAHTPRSCTGTSRLYVISCPDLHRTASKWDARWCKITLRVHWIYLVMLTFLWFRLRRRVFVCKRTRAHTHKERTESAAETGVRVGYNESEAHSNDAIFPIGGIYSHAWFPNCFKMRRTSYLWRVC